MRLFEDFGAEGPCGEHGHLHMALYRYVEKLEPANTHDVQYGQIVAVALQKLGGVFKGCCFGGIRFLFPRIC